MRIKRFTAMQRLFHLLLAVSFMVQAATGLARMYIEAPFGVRLASLFGGYAGALEVHKWGGACMAVLFIVHLVYALSVVVRIGREDSLVPGWGDVTEFCHHTLWILGLGKEPRFGRWTWWERFDYWAVFWGMVVMSITGLMLWSPVVTARFIDGWWCNVALWVHRIEAVLAMGHVFIIHYLVAHLRPSNFPMDPVIFEGVVSMERVRHERPAWADRLTQQDSTPATSAALRMTGYLAGATLVVCGVYLLLNGLANALAITL